jgi:predicted Zn-dependent protease with MMP-like domain
MTHREFEQSITDALLTVPEHIRARMDNVAFVVEDFARRPGREEDGIRGHGVLLGLYQGVPLIDRGADYSLVLPDKITIFKDTIEELGRADPARIRRIVRDTVLHEVAHHLGFSEDEVRRWEQKRKTRKA